jgi:hypothetical protein
MEHARQQLAPRQISRRAEEDDYLVFGHPARRRPSSCACSVDAHEFSLTDGSWLPTRSTVLRLTSALVALDRVRAAEAGVLGVEAVLAQ